MKTLLLIVSLVGISGCSHVADTRSAIPEMEGVFSFGAFDLEVYLRLARDGSYRETDIGPLVQMLPDGRKAESLREQGRFSVRGDKLFLIPEKGARRELAIIASTPVRLEERFKGRTRIYSKLKSEPNQALQPTAPSGRGSS
jgi:hypothetical protein